MPEGNENESSTLGQRRPVVLNGLALFSFEDAESTFTIQRGCSSAGRAPALQAGGQEFDPPHLHQNWAHSSGG